MWYDTLLTVTTIAPQYLIHRRGKKFVSVKLMVYFQFFNNETVNVFLATTLVKKILIYLKKQKNFMTYQKLMFHWLCSVRTCPKSLSLFFSTHFDNKTTLVLKQMSWIGFVWFYFSCDPGNNRSTWSPHTGSWRNWERVSMTKKKQKTLNYSKAKKRRQGLPVSFNCTQTGNIQNSCCKSRNILEDD